MVIIDLFFALINLELSELLISKGVNKGQSLIKLEIVALKGWLLPWDVRVAAEHSVCRCLDYAESCSFVVNSAVASTVAEAISCAAVEQLGLFAQTY